MPKNLSVSRIFFDKIIIKYPKVILALVLLLTVFLLFQAKNFRLDASSETLLLENDKDLLYWRQINNRYGENDFLVITYTPYQDLFSENSLNRLKNLRDELLSMKSVSSVRSILDVPLLQYSTVSLKQLTGELLTLTSPDIDTNLAKTELTTSPLYQNLLISSDAKTAALLITFSNETLLNALLVQRDDLRKKENSGSLTESEKTELKTISEKYRQQKDAQRQLRHQDIAAVRNIADKYSNNAQLFLGGVSMIVDDMISFIKSDLKIFGSSVLVTLILMLGIIFKKKRWVFIAVVNCVISAICMIGLLGWLRWDVTVISSNFISLQMIMTLAMTIHLIVRYRELHSENPDTDNRKLILETLMLKLKPCIYAALTTIVGFGSLIFCDIEPVIMFGWMMMIGLAISLITTFVMFPAILILIPKADSPKLRRSPFSITSVLSTLTKNHGILIIVISSFMFIAAVLGISKLKVENSFIDYFHKDTEIYKGMKVIDQKLGGTTPLDVIIDFEQTPLKSNDQDDLEDEMDDLFEEFEQASDDDKYWFTSEKMSRIKEVHNYLQSLPEIGKVLSLATIMEVAEKLNDDKPLTSLELALLYNETPENFKDMLLKPYVSVEHSQARFWARIRDSEKNLRRDDLLKKINAHLKNDMSFDADNTHLTGMLVLYNNVLQSLFTSQKTTLGITAAILAAMFLILFRSIKVTLIVMVANILPIAVVLGIMGWMGIPLDMMTITIAAISLGIAVDDTIHYIHRFKKDIKKTGDYNLTMLRCHKTIGYAMCYTSITIIIGFSIMILSNFIPSVYFGVLTVLAMAMALLAALTLLPRLLIIFKPFGKEMQNNRTGE